MESIDELPNFKAIIKGDECAYPYIYFENIRVAIPALTRPSETTILTGVYPGRHGVVSSLWFDRKEEKVISPLSLSQRGVIEILNKTNTDTLFDYARRSGKKTMAVTTQVGKGLDNRDWIRQGALLWGRAFFTSLFGRRSVIPDPGHLDQGTTKGLLYGYRYSIFDGLKGRLLAQGDIPDVVHTHYVGLDVAAHYPRPFKVQENWTVDQTQKSYLRESLDPELGKIVAYLKQKNVFENTIFLFISDQGQTRVLKRIDDDDFEKMLSEDFCVRACLLDQNLKVAGRGYSVGDAHIILMPGARTKTIYVRNRTQADWLSPPRLLDDIEPVVARLLDDKDVIGYLNYLLIAQYPGERDEGREEREAFWFLDTTKYRQSDRNVDDFLAALEPFSKLDEYMGEAAKAAHMYGRNYNRESKPDIVFINKPGYFFARDEEIYCLHGSIYGDDALVSLVISGPGIHRFSARPQTITQQIDTVDVVAIAAYLAGITIDKTIDGKNRLSGVK